MGGGPACGDNSAFSGLEFKPNDAHYLDRADFIADCQVAVDDICSQMDVMCAPFACTHRQESYPTFFTSLGIANGNSALALTLAGIVLSKLATKIAGNKKDEATLRGSGSEMQGQPLAIVRKSADQPGPGL